MRTFKIIRYTIAVALVAVCGTCVSSGQVVVEFRERGASRGERKVEQRTVDSVQAERKLQSADPSLVSQLFGVAVEAYLIGRNSEAQARFTALVDYTDDSHGASRYYLAILNQAVGNLAKAREHIDRAVTLEPANLDYQKLQAILMLEAEDFVAANALLERLQSLLPKEANLKVLYMLSLYNSNQKPKMIDIAADFENTFGFDPRVTGMKSQYYIENKRFEELLAYNTKVVAAQPSPENLVGLARVQASLSMDSLAEGNYTRALALDQDISAKVAFSDYKRIKGDAQGAFELLRSILFDSLVRADAKVEMLTDLLRAGLQTTDKFDLNAVIDSIGAVTPDNEFRDFTIDYLLFQRKIEEAFVLLQKGYAQGNLDKQRSIYLMQIYFDKKLLPSSLQVATKLQKDYPDDTQLMGMIIFLNMELGNQKAGLRMADIQIKAATTDSLRSVAYATRGDLYQHFKQSRKAFADYRTATQYDSLNATALNNWAYYTSLQENVSEAQLLEALDRAVKANEIEQMNPTFIDTQAWVLYRLGQLSEAKRMILLAIGLQKMPSADLYMHAGDIFNALGEREKATNYWRQALENGAAAQEVERRINNRKP